MSTVAHRGAASLAVAHHQVKHNLTISSLTIYDDNEIRIYPTHGQQNFSDWVASIHVDDVTTRPHVDGGTFTHVHGRLPDTGVRVTVITYTSSKAAA